jgi:hemerythrin-like metal-binding protein
MPFIEWGSAISVNIADIDSQHKILVGMVNTLHDAMSQGKGKDVIGKTLDELIKYTQSHFGYEESKMKASAYAGYLSHKMEHDRLTRQVLDLQTQYRAGKASLTIEVLNFLKDWLVNHIQGVDRKTFLA